MDNPNTIWNVGNITAHSITAEEHFTQNFEVQNLIVDTAMQCNGPAIFTDDVVITTPLQIGTSNNNNQYVLPNTIGQPNQVLAVPSSGANLEWVDSGSGGNIVFIEGNNITITDGGNDEYTFSTTIPVPSLINDDQVLGVVNGSFQFVNNGGGAGSVNSVTASTGLLNTGTSANVILTIDPTLQADSISVNTATVGTTLTGGTMNVGSVNTDNLSIDSVTFPNPNTAQDGQFLSVYNGEMTWSNPGVLGITGGTGINTANVQNYTEISLNPNVDVTSVATTTFELNNIPLNVPQPADNGKVLSYNDALAQMEWVISGGTGGTGIQSITGKANQIEIDDTDPNNPIIQFPTIVPVFFPNGIVTRVTEAKNNQSIGSGALLSNTSGVRNTAIGTNALGSNTSGQQNIAIGNESLANSTTTSSNLCIGENTMQFNVNESDNNIVIGHATAVNLGNGGVAGLSEGGNIILGNNTANQLNSGYENIVIGFNTFSGATGDSGNIVLAVDSFKNSYGCYNNVFITQDTDPPLVGGFNNVFLGEAIGTQLTSSNDSIIIGDGAGNILQSSSFNTIMGTNACNYTETASYTTAIGYRTLENCINSSNNVAIGDLAGLNLNGGSNNLFLGINSQPTAGTISNQIVLGSSSHTTLNVPCASLDYGITTAETLTFGHTLDTTALKIDGIPLVAPDPLTDGGKILSYNNTTNAMDWIPAGGGGGNVQQVIGTANEVSVDNTDPDNPIVGLPSTIILGTGSNMCTEDTFTKKIYITSNDVSVPVGESSVFGFPWLSAAPANNSFICADGNTPSSGSSFKTISQLVQNSGDINIYPNVDNTVNLHLTSTNKTTNAVLTSNSDILQGLAWTQNVNINGIAADTIQIKSTPNNSTPLALPSITDGNLPASNNIMVSTGASMIFVPPSEIISNTGDVISTTEDTEGRAVLQLNASNRADTFLLQSIGTTGLNWTSSNITGYMETIYSTPGTLTAYPNVFYSFIIKCTITNGIRNIKFMTSNSAEINHTIAPVYCAPNFTVSNLTYVQIPYNTITYISGDNVPFSAYGYHNDITYNNNLFLDEQINGPFGCSKYNGSGSIVGAGDCFILLDGVNLNIQFTYINGSGVRELLELQAGYGYYFCSNVAWSPVTTSICFTIN